MSPLRKDRMHNTPQKKAKKPKTKNLGTNAPTPTHGGVRYNLRPRPVAPPEALRVYVRRPLPRTPLPY